MYRSLFRAAAIYTRVDKGVWANLKRYTPEMLGRIASWLESKTAQTFREINGFEMRHGAESVNSKKEESTSQSRDETN